MPWGVFLIGALVAAGALAEVYKSVDENGNVVYSQQPPRDRKAEVVTPKFVKQPVAAPAATGSPPPAEPPAAASEAAMLTPEQISAKQKNCQTAQQQLTELQSPRANRLQYTNEQKQLAFLTPEQLQARIAEAQNALKKYCE